MASMRAAAMVLPLVLLAGCVSSEVAPVTVEATIKLLGADGSPAGGKFVLQYSSADYRSNPAVVTGSTGDGSLAVAPLENCREKGTLQAWDHDSSRPENKGGKLYGESVFPCTAKVIEVRVRPT